MNRQKKIITVDDNLSNLSAMKNILKPLYEVYPVSSAAKMFDLLEHIDADLILLDVEMPEINGYDAARILKSNHAHSNIPIIFVTVLNSADNEMEGLEIGAVDYIYKPFFAPLLLRRIETHLSLAEHKKELEKLNAIIQKKLIIKTGEVFELQNAILNIVAEMVENRDDTTGGHINRIQRYLGCLIDSMMDMNLYSNEISAWNMDFLVPSSQLHDLGKIAISDTILNKPGKFVPAEFEIMKTHAQIGVDAICRMEKNTTDCSFLKYAKIFAGTHHEKWDGTGYPIGLAGEGIPLEGRLMAIADVYDALVTVRPYKEPFTHGKSVEIIKSGSGNHFDPALVEVFDSVSDKFEEIAVTAH